MNSKRRDSLRDSQSGIASLLVTMVLMIVISLIVLGFAQVSRREQQNTLDHQLSTQAFYAAESGINDAEAVISSALVQGATVPPKTSCTGSQPGDIYSTLDYNVTKNTSEGVKYTCLLVTTQVPDLEKTLGTDQEWVTPIYPVATDGTPKAITNLNITWPPDTAGQTSLTDCPTNVSTYITNPTLANWKTCAYGAVRIDLVPVPAGTTSRAALTANDMVVFAYPSTGGGTFVYSNGVSAGSTHQVFAKCNGNGTSTCVLDISGLTAPAGTTYYARIHMLYKSTSNTQSLKITAADQATQANDPSTLFSGAQAQIDSTGKAQDVLRRVRVAVSLTSNPQYSPYALESRDSICKRYTIAPDISPVFQVPASITKDPTNPTC